MEPTNGIVQSVIPEIELHYRSTVKRSALPVVQTSGDAYQLFLATWDETKIDFVEQFRVMLLNRANRVLGICTLTTGSSTQVIVDIRSLFALALLKNACCIIVAHNHPSGALTPSKSDSDLFSRLQEAGRILDIQVLDQLIVTAEGYYSFSDEGV